MTTTREEVIRVARECGFSWNPHSQIIARHSNGSWVDIANIVERIATHFYEAGAAAAREPLVKALDRANHLLAELTFSEWIPKKDVPSIDIRQRINAAHVIASSALTKATGEKA